MDYFVTRNDDFLYAMKHEEYYDLPLTSGYTYIYELTDCNSTVLVDADGNVVTPDVSESNEISKTNGHTLTHIPYKAPTATQSGNIEHWYCEDCDKNYLDEIGYTIADNVILPPTGSGTYPSYTGVPSWVTTPVSSTTTTTTKAPVDDEVIDDDINEDDDSVVDEDTDTTKPADDEEDYSSNDENEDDDSSVDEDFSSDVNNDVSADGEAAEDEDDNPLTGVVISFTGVIISAAAVMLARKRKNK